MAEVANVLGYVVLTYRVYREDDQFVGRCDELGVSTCADTIDDAFSGIDECVSLYLETIEELGERERIFRERAIELRPGRPAADEDVLLRVRPNEYVAQHSVEILAA
jgi:predicted RNase H-like HicB family nuclease